MQNIIATTIVIVLSSALSTPATGRDHAALRKQVLALGELADCPEVYPADGFAEQGGIKPIYYDGLPWQGKPTRVFAWLGLPQKAEGSKAESKVPGIVLVHGGGGTAFKEWVKLWNAKGFAAISIAVEGQTDERDPTGKGWKRHDWAGPNRDGIYGDSAQPLADQWMYHAVADTVLANSLLRSIPEVDAEKVGLMGISWGGIITSTVIGIDRRFAFGIPTYGCGDLATAENQYGRALGKNTLYREVWDPMVRMKNAKLPTLWLSWTGDQHFPLDSLRNCCLAAPGPHMVALLPNMRHGHAPGWNPPDSYAFAESVVQTGDPWCRQLGVQVDAGNARVSFKSTKAVEKAVLVSTSDTGFTGRRRWTDAPAEVTQNKDRVIVNVTLPTATTAWFINMHSGDLVASSDLQDDAAGAPLPSKPNFIFILTDDQGYGDLGRHGHPLLKTPNLDRLYDQSVRFDNFYVSASCSPTRAALLTGMHEFKNGVTHTTAPREHLHRDAVILPQLLKTAGYRTGFIGKWHLGNSQGYTPSDRGFDWCSTNVGGPRVHFNPDIIRNKVREKRQGFREDLFFDEAMTFIAENRNNPFFCYLSTYSPHTPLAAPEKFIAEPFRDKVDQEQAAYLGMVANIDDNVGRLLNHLRELGLEENTIIIFMNDNGQTKGLDVFNAGMRGCKCTIWQGGRRAMSLWRWPRQWQPHAVSNLTAHLDLLPTVCDLAGARVPEQLHRQLDGFSLRPLLESKEKLAWHEDRMLFHHVARWPSGLAASHKYAMAAVRQGDYLLVRSHPCDDDACQQFQSQCRTLRLVEAGAVRATYTKENAQFHWGVTPRDRWTLFDIKRDPTCSKDLAPDKPDLVAPLAAAYDKWWDAIYPIMIRSGGDKGEATSIEKGPPSATRKTRTESAGQ